MKHKSVILRAAVGIVLLFLCSYSGLTQEKKKERIRISADYINLMDGYDYLDIKVTARINKETVFVSDIELTILADNEEIETVLGSTHTDIGGEAVFVLNNPEYIIPDSTHIYTLKIRFEGNEMFRSATKIIQFKKAKIRAEVQSKDSINYMVATLRDEATDSIVEGESLGVYVDRLFMPLPIGEEFNFTDENGTIIVPIENDIPGIDGILTLQVELSEHEEYGTVKAQLKAPIGVPIVEDTTFFNRTMWSSRDKTPLFLLIFPNLMILAMWGIIVYLFRNLFKIAKN